MLSSEFDYFLPQNLIAQNPVEERDASWLLVFDKSSGNLNDQLFSSLPDLLLPGDLVVLNDSRVFPARVHAIRVSTGGHIELLFIRPLKNDSWLALTRSGGRLAPGEQIRIDPPGIALTLVERRGADGDLLSIPPLFDMEAFLQSHGQVPLPPYIRRPDGSTPEDRERYQTIFASETGSVAAPTAGLHFSSAIMDRLSSRGIRTAFITLHVGPGTFRPVKTESIDDHRVSPERCRISIEAADAVNLARAEKRRVIAVGTTVVRTLESRSDDAGVVHAGDGETDLFIHPPYRFKVIDSLLTNFHLPKSTLLMLVCAFAGREKTLNAYSHAIKSGYRFYSYGDAMLIL
jgi:S-adenosylmethionine:tRNA ribosyltransferase-isomerase